MSPLENVDAHETVLTPTGNVGARANWAEWESASDRVARILLIDGDSTLVAEHVRRALPSGNHEVTAVHTGASGVEHVRAAPPDIVLLDLDLPDQSGLAVHQQIRDIDARVPVVFITESTAADSVIEAMRQGAFNYLRKPLDPQQLREVVAEALDVAERSHPPTLSTSAGDEHDAFVGRSKPLLEACKAIGLVAAQDVTVLITGESGTGKEVAARAMCKHSARASAPFVTLNCAAIPESLLESELFGHERGAFTGADRRRIGKFEQCHGGTLLLDEIGDMPLSLQAKMLRVLQEQEFQRVGGSETIQTDVRVIAATHRDLRSLVAEGKFRADLYYRLAVCTVDLPPLRERGDDLAILAHHFLARYNYEFGRDVRQIAPEAMALLRAYPWPGNVRELQSVLKQALLRARGTILLPAFLPELSQRVSRSAPPPVNVDLDGFISDRLSPGMNDLYAETHREVDRVLFTRVLDYTNGNQRNAAQMLGIARQTMRGKLRALAMHLTRSLVRSDDLGVSVN